MKKRIAILLVMALLVVSVVQITPSRVSAADPFLVDKALHWINCPVPATYMVKVIVHNKSGADKVFGVLPWVNFTYPDEEQELLPSAWIVRITPEPLLLPNDTQMIYTVEYAIPEEGMNRTFKTWLKVCTDPQTMDIPVTVIIRTGNAIPTNRISSSPSSYRLRVYGTNARVVVDDPSNKDAPPISIRNEGSGIASIFAQAEYPGKDIVISADSGIDHSPDEIGLVFKALSTAEAREWFSTPFIFDNPLNIPSLNSGYLTWSLAVPDEIENGYYSMGIRISSTDAPSGMSIGINHLILLLIHVDRESPAPLESLLSRMMNWFWPWGWVGLSGFVGIIAIRKVIKVIRRRFRNKRINQEISDRRQARKVEIA